VGQRFLYLWGIKPDVWALPPSVFLRTGLRAVYIIACLGFFLGIFFSWAKRKEFLAKLQWKIYLVLLGVLGPPLLLYGNQRFLIPVIPLVAIFQAIALVEIWNWLYGQCSRFLD
jgi:CHASE2 domain-containing sensor protein